MNDKYSTAKIKKELKKKIKKKAIDNGNTFQKEVEELLLIGLKNKYFCGDKNES